MQKQAWGSGNYLESQKMLLTMNDSTVSGHNVVRYVPNAKSAVKIRRDSL